MASSAEDYCLKWNDHHTTFFSSAENLCHAQALTDVTLSAGKREFAAHKLVLSVCSGYFSGLFAKASSRNNDSRHAIVYLKDVDPRHMELLLSYMYRGEINVQESELYGLLATAKSLQIKGLTDAEDNGGNEPARTAAPPQQPRPPPRPTPPPSVMSPTIIVAPSTAGAATGAPASSVLRTNTLVLKPKLPPLNNTPTVKLASRGNPLVTINNPNKRPATVTGIEQPGGDPAKRVKEEQDIVVTAWSDGGGSSSAAATTSPSATAAVNTTNRDGDEEFEEEDEDEDDFGEEDDDNIGGIDLPAGGGAFGDSTIQFISTGTSGLQPGTSGFDMGARFDGRSECSVCLKTFRDNHTLKQHLLIHTGAKPYACKICPTMRFNHKSNAVKHISKLHNVDRKEALKFLHEDEDIEDME